MYINKEKDIKLEFLSLPKHPNRPHRGIRLIHLPTGKIGECDEYLSVQENYKFAFVRLIKEIDKNEQN